jgi:hypothetical protein
VLRDPYENCLVLTEHHAKELNPGLWFMSYNIENMYHDRSGVPCQHPNDPSNWPIFIAAKSVRRAFLLQSFGKDNRDTLASGEYKSKVCFLFAWLLACLFVLLSCYITHGEFSYQLKIAGICFLPFVVLARRSDIQVAGPTIPLAHKNGTEKNSRKPHHAVQ